MGHARPRPTRLAGKLLQIRRSLGMSQPQIAKHLGVKDYSDVSKYELGKNEPPLVVLLAYSKLSGHSINDLADDRVNLSA